MTAKGVEDGETLKALKAMNCDTIQGYHLCRPQGEANLLAFLEHNTEQVRS